MELRPKMVMLKGFRSFLFPFFFLDSFCSLLPEPPAARPSCVGRTFSCFRICRSPSKQRQFLRLQSPSGVFQFILNKSTCGNCG